ncbi:hypothetical protein [Novosphingobium sp.]|uniref:hypothetical protein n=1 Tax=Novosphingobium sp. TaxID=1874826 RepID=UPI00262AE4A4|nr:hypothetical protein [Novosphingobium sp.]
MFNIYLATSSFLPDPVTIIAENHDEAALLFTIWRSFHVHGDHVVSAEITKLSEADLALTPQLAELTQSMQPGIARWVGHREGWIVSAPDDLEPAGEIALPECPMTCFAFETPDDGRVLVVAETLERAIATLHLYSLDQNGWDAEYSSVNEISPWPLTGPMVTLREEMFEGKTGVGAECEDGFWRIFPADYTPPLRKRDGSERQRTER